MYGNVLTDRQLNKLIADKCLYISPFNPASLKETVYTLNPGRVLKMTSENEWEVAHSFSTKKAPFILEPNEYVVVEARQTVKIAVDGLVGTFVSTSTNVEAGLLVVAGQIDSHYGMRGEALRFGVKNLLPMANTISADTRLVHMQLTDLRGSTADPVVRTPNEGQVWESRRRDERWERADSDGPSHDMPG